MSYVYVAHCGSHGLLIFARFKLRFNFHPKQLNIRYGQAKSGRRATESRSWRAVLLSLRSMSRHVSRDADPDATFFGFRAEAADLPGGTVRNVLEHRSGPSRSEPYGTVNGRRFRSTVTVG